MTTSNPPAAGPGCPRPGADEAFRAEVSHQAGVGGAAGGGDVAAEDRRELDDEHAGAAGAALDHQVLDLSPETPSQLRAWFAHPASPHASEPHSGSYERADRVQSGRGWLGDGRSPMGYLVTMTIHVPDR